MKKDIEVWLFISVLKHNKSGWVMQMAVFLNNFERANGLLDGKDGVASQYGKISYYKDDALVKWAPNLRIEKVLEMRIFWDLQQNQEMQTEEG